MNGNKVQKRDIRGKKELRMVRGGTEERSWEKD